MVSRQELWSRMQVDFRFSKQELVGLIVGMLVFGFIFSFRDWGSGDNVDLVAGSIHLVLTILIASISLIVHESTHRYFALGIGYKSEFKVWYGGLIASLVLALVSNGVVQLVLPGGMVNAVMARHRLGEFRYGLNYWENGMIALYGPLSNLLLAFLAKIFLLIAPNSWFLQKFVYLNIIFAICTMLPIPPLDGISVFFGSRILYVMAFIGILASSVLIYLTSFWLAALGALLAMTIGTIVYYIKVEGA